MGRKLILLFCICLAFPGAAFAATYWVSPEGQASWSSCNSETPLAGASACSRQTANTNVVAGDTVYFRGGTYTINLYSVGIYPSRSGSEGNPITFIRYSNEVPVISTSASSDTYGVYLSGKSYIKIDGITFQNLPVFGYVVDGSHHNEIANCTFNAIDGNDLGVGLKINGTACATHDCWNTHNWIHHNTFSKRNNSPCSEARDIIRIGEAYSSSSSPYAVQDNFNTIENNVIYGAAHAAMDNYGQYNVIRNNIAHNEPWRTGCTSWIDSYWSSTSSVSVGAGSKSLTIQTGASISAGQTIGMLYIDDRSKVMRGTVTSYNSSTGALVINVVDFNGTGTYSSWIVGRGQIPEYENSEYNNKYGHRVFQVSDDYGRDGLYNLYEGNRLGHASLNMNNDGAENFSVAAPRNIIRYNFLFGSMASAIYFKYAKSNPYPLGVGISHSWGGAWNAVYNNTIYRSGYGWDSSLYGWANMSYSYRGIAQYNTNEYDADPGLTGNIIINNIVYDSKAGDICKIGRVMPCTARDWDFVDHNWLTSNGDPMFVDTSLSDPSSAILPDLSLVKSSNAIDGGTYLTMTSGSGSGSTTLVVDNALFFQDGTWGSELSAVSPDWIAIGEVTNVVQISSIDYDTNTITLAMAITWSDNDPVWLYKKSDGVQVLRGAGPDYGAYEYTGSDPVSTSTQTGVVFTGVSLQ